MYVQRYSPRPNVLSVRVRNEGAPYTRVYASGNLRRKIRGYVAVANALKIHPFLLPRAIALISHYHAWLHFRLANISQASTICVTGCGWHRH